MMKAVLAVAALGVLLATAQTATAGTCDEKTFMWDGVMPIPDNDPAGAAVMISVPDDGCLISDLDVEMTIVHAWQGDLIITVTDPNGQSVELMNRAGAPEYSVFGFSADNFGTGTGTDGVFTFDDEAAMTYDEPHVPGPGIADVSGAWQPENPLSAYDDGRKVGDWWFHVSDNAAGDVGEIQHFALHFENVPEPTSLALLGVGGLAMFRRRRR
ncbi:MAG: PEP-CTERM sorting domain-containing protein [bacterium]|nr:PEP-CTERM sorting domain-containing protein [bacterium]